MTKFKLPKPRFDRKIANEGREIYITDENGTYWGTFRIALVDNLSPKVQIAVEKYKRKYAALAQRGKAVSGADRLQAEAFVELALLDWKGVNDWSPDAEDGAEMKFSPEKALEFFTLSETDEETGETYYHTAWLLQRLSREAEDITNFQPAEQTEDVEGN